MKKTIKPHKYVYFFGGGKTDGNESMKKVSEKYWMKNWPGIQMKEKLK